LTKPSKVIVIAYPSAGCCVANAFKIDILLALLSTITVGSAFVATDYIAAVMVD